MSIDHWLLGGTLLAGMSLQGPTGTPSRIDAPQAFALPSPTGRHAVGTTAWRVTDESRSENLAGSGLAREVEVLAWYPATPGRGKPAPYLRWGLFEVRPLAPRGATKTPFDSLVDVRTHARVDAQPATTPAKLPVLVFSHGYGGMPSAYTAMLEDLASHGYAILSIVHPYEAAAAMLADGRLVSFLDEDGTPRQSFREVLNEWSREDETMAAVTRAAGEDEQRRLLGGYLSGLRATDVALRRWVDDTKLVLDRLTALPAGSAAARLATRLDTGRLGVFGHSMGGVTAGQFCLEDRRCVAGLNLDGIPQYGSMIDRPLSRPFLMVYSARAGRTGASDAIYRRSASPYYRVDVRDTLHLDFSDMIFWGGPLRDRGALGTLTPVRAAEITRAIVRQYFDQELLKKRSTMLAGTSAFPEVTVHLPQQNRGTSAPAAKERP
jgi:pimeloyl-ACP methyl ester carboxylesterase